MLQQWFSAAAASVRAMRCYDPATVGVMMTLMRLLISQTLIRAGGTR